MTAYARKALLLALWLVPAAAHAQSLLEFYRNALETNPALRTKEFGVDQAKAQKDQAVSRLLPQVSLTAEMSRNELDESGLGAVRRYPGTRNSLQVRQALFDLASYFRIEGARATVLQSEQEREAARFKLAGDVVDRYLAVLQAVDDIAHLQAEMTAVAAQLQRLRFMRERQLAKLTDLLDTEAYYGGLQTREIEARNAHAVAIERLREITGVQSPRVVASAPENFAPVPGRLEEWVATAMRGNPNLVALEHAIESAQSLIESSRAEHFPQAALSISKTYSDQSFDNRLVPSYNVGTAAIQLTIPLYAGGRVNASVREGIARLEQARQAYDGARRQTEREIRTNYLNALASHARIDSTSQEVRTRQQAVEAQQTGFNLGVATIVDVLVAQQGLHKARAAQSKARYDYIRDIASLRIQAGTLSQEDIEEISRALSRGEL